MSFRLHQMATCALVFRCFLPAQETPGPDPLLALLNTSVVSASKLAQSPLKSPAMVVSVSAEDIRVRGYMSLEEVLHDLPGFDFNKGRGVEWSTIFMRGVRSDNSDRFLVIWDGVLQTDMWKANNWLSRQYPLSNVARIEVMYGASSLLWGANAFSGIINVILKHEVDAGTSVQVAGGSYRTRSAEVNFGKDLASGWRFMFNARSFRSDEFDMHDRYWVDNLGRQRYYGLDFPRDYVPPTDPRYGQLGIVDGLPTYTKNGQTLSFDGRTADTTKDWFVQAGLGYKDLEIRFTSWSDSKAQDPWYVAQKRMKALIIPTGSALSATYDLQFTPQTRAKIYANARTSGLDGDSGAPTNSYYIRNNAADPLDLKVYQIGNYNSVKLLNREYRAGVLFTFLGEAFSAVYGGEYVDTINSEDYTSRSSSTLPWIYTPTHSNRDLALFGNVQGDLSEYLAVAAGLRYDYNYAAGEAGGFGHLFTPRLAVILRPHADHTLKLIQSHSFEAPSAWAAYSSVTGIRMASPSLKPERLNSFEAIWTYTPTSRLRTTLTGYYTQIENSIILAPSPTNPSLQQHQNSGGYTVFGSEMEARFLMARDKSIYLNASSALTKDRVTGRRIGDIAPLKANFGTDLVFDSRWGISFRGHYVSQRDTLNWDAAPGTQLYNYSKKSVDTYLTADLTLSWFEVFKGFTLRLNFYNVGNKAYYDPGPRTAEGLSYNSAILQEGFRGFLGLSYGF